MHLAMPTVHEEPGRVWGPPPWPRGYPHQQGERRLSDPRWAAEGTRSAADAHDREPRLGPRYHGQLPGRGSPDAAACARTQEIGKVWRGAGEGGRTAKDSVCKGPVVHRNRRGSSGWARGPVETGPRSSRRASWDPASGRAGAGCPTPTCRPAVVPAPARR